MEQTAPEQILHYVTAEKIGEGRTGTVFKTWDTVLERFVALKILRPELMAIRSFRAQVLSTLRALSDSDHPNIATLYGVHKLDDGRYVVASELTEGNSLRGLIRRGPIDNETFLEIARPVVSALRFAHDRHILHGNIRPSNIVMREDGSVRLLDFGMSTLVVEREVRNYPADTEIIRYRAPEQITGEELTPLADLFALGAVFYEALAGAPAFPGTHRETVEEKILHEQPDFNRLQPDQRTPGDTILVLEKLLGKDTEDRFSGTGQVEITLREIDTFEKTERSRRTFAVKPEGSRGYLMISLLAALLVIFWLVITTVGR